MKVYRAADAPSGGLVGETVAVLGYGNLGRSAALNLRDRDLRVMERLVAAQDRLLGIPAVAAG